MSAKLWIVTLAKIALVTAWLKYSPHGSARAADAPPASLPRVVVSKPLVENLDTRLSFLGQFSAVSQVELRGQVGGTLTGIFFKDGDIVQQGDLLFTIDARPYEIRLARETAQLDVATARLEWAERQLDRAKDLEQSNAGTVENVDQRTSDQRAARASVEEAKARIRDAQFDLDHCRITAPFTGRIGTHLVSVGNRIAGSRTSASPTTLLAMLVSLDPIHFAFLDNVLDRSSGTIHARATVPNSDFVLMPGQFALARLVVAPPSPTLLVPDAAVLRVLSVRLRKAA